MQELPTNNTNFLFESTKDFNQTTHGGLQDPIVFIYSISSYFNCLGSVQDVFKWLHNGHIMLSSRHITEYLIKPRKYFLQTNNFKFSFKKTHYFKDELTRPIINTSLFYNSHKSSK